MGDRLLATAGTGFKIHDINSRHRPQMSLERRYGGTAPPLTYDA